VAIVHAGASCAARGGGGLGLERAMRSFQQELAGVDDVGGIGRERDPICRPARAR
jgi:hypothetical protein